MNKGSGRERFILDGRPLRTSSTGKEYTLISSFSKSQPLKDHAAESPNIQRLAGWDLVA